MSEQRRGFVRLNDLNLSSFWWHAGTEWTSVIRNEVTPDKDDSVESYSGAHKPIVYSVFAILALLGAAIITRSGQISQRVETAQNQPVQQIMLSDK
ncbi:hypothetical protein NIES4071_95640 [Calothrix sp. NIES-4071]|nr:hypothetical protein NIES4071_95640 [Calothrix sp. NIES-4071]BAZ63829.1 hypothetical protein NIES4105_95570 [Calothrix sp. NIES-4105]